MTKQFLPKSRWLVTIILLLVLGFGQMWGAKITYTFSSAAWAASPANWSGSKNGNQFNTSATPLGVQVCEGQSGVTVTSPTSYTNITKVEVVYSSSSKATGSINIKIGTNSALGAKSISKSQTRTTLTFTPASAQTGSVVMTCNVSKNSMGINSVTIYYETAVTLSRNSGAADGSVKFAHDATAYTTSTFTPVTRGGYNCTGYWTASSGGTQILNADGSFAAANVSVSTTSYITSSKWAYEGATLTLHAQWESAAACSENPSIGAASLNGSFNLSSVGVSCASSGAGTNCSITEYGWVWSDGANNTNPLIGGSNVTNSPKTSGAPSGSGGSFTGELSGSFTLGHTYYYKAYVTNGKPATVYSDVQTFTPRQVTFHKNDGGSTTSTQIVKGGVATALTANAWSRTGYSFNGWNTNADGKSGANYADGANITASANVDLYAKWQEKTKYTITLNAGNGTISDANWTNTSGSTYTRTQSNGDESITLPTPSCNCTGWTFKGWSTSSKDGANSFTPDKADGASFVPTSNVTYYAVYRASTPTGTTYTKITDEDDLTTGDYAIVANSSSYYAMGNSISSGHMTESSSFSASDSWTNSTANYIWNVIKIGDKVGFYNDDAGKFLTIVDGAWVLATEVQWYTYSFNSTTKAWTFTSPSGKQMKYETYYYVGDAQTSPIYLYKRGNTESGNYYTSPSCAGLAVTGVSDPVGAANVTISATAAHDGDKIWAYYTINRGYSFNRWDKSGTGASLSSTSTQLTRLTVGSSDATVTAVCDALTSYTLNYHDGNGDHTKTVYEGENILDLLPTPSASCDGTSTTFVGWSTTAIFIKTDDEPTFVSSSAVINSTTAAETYYAVYAAGSRYWGRATSSDLSSLAAGSKLVIVAVDQGYVLKNDLTCSSTVPSETDGVIATPDNDLIWELAGSSGEWQLKSGTDILGTQYSNCAGSGNGLGLNFNTHFQEYSIASSSYGTNNFYIKANSCTEGVLTKVSKYDDFRVVTISSYSSAASAALKLYMQKGSYSQFITTCCDKIVTLADGSPSNGTVTFSPTGAVATCNSSANVTMTITPSTGYYLSGYSSSGVSTSNTPSIATSGSTSEGAQAISLTFATSTNGTYTAGATFSQIPVSGWSFTNHRGGATITDDALVVYVGQKVQLDITYAPVNAHSDHKAKEKYSQSSVSTYIYNPSKASAYFTFTGNASTGGNTTTITLTHDDGPTKNIYVEVRALPSDTYLDLIHGVAFANQTASLSDSDYGVDFTYTAPGSDTSDWTGSYKNDCEEVSEHLIGWVDSEWADKHLGEIPTTGEVTAAKLDDGTTPAFHEKGSSMTAANRTYYAVWAKVE
jgi:uncharacterized repeat protein (TIGR02543 family)